MILETLELPPKSNSTPNAIIRKPYKALASQNCFSAAFYTMFGGEIAILLPNILKFPSCGIQYLDVAGKISLAVNFAKAIEMLVCNICDIQLMVT